MALGSGDDGSAGAWLLVKFSRASKLAWLRRDVLDESVVGMGGRPLRRFPTLAEKRLLGTGPPSSSGCSGSAICTAKTSEYFV